MVLHYHVASFSTFVDGYMWEVLVEDAAERRYGVPYSPLAGFGPEGFR